MRQLQPVQRRQLARGATLALSLVLAVGRRALHEPLDTKCRDHTRTLALRRSCQTTTTATTRVHAAAVVTSYVGTCSPVEATRALWPGQTLRWVPARVWRLAHHGTATVLAATLAVTPTIRRQVAVLGPRRCFGVILRLVATRPMCARRWCRTYGRTRTRSGSFVHLKGVITVSVEVGGSPHRLSAADGGSLV